MKASELLDYKNWIVVGDVTNTDKYASKILSALKSENYNVVGVNPRGTGKEVYKSLEEVPFNIEVIDLCINPKLGIEIVKTAKKLKIDKILIQPGASSEEIMSYCKEEGITAINDCALVQLGRR